MKRILPGPGPVAEPDMASPLTAFQRPRPLTALRTPAGSTPAPAGGTAMPTASSVLAAVGATARPATASVMHRASLGAGAPRAGSITSAVAGSVRLLSAGAADDRAVAKAPAGLRAADDRAALAVLKSDILLLQKRFDEVTGKSDLNNASIERALAKYTIADDARLDAEARLALLELRDKKMVQLELVLNDMHNPGQPERRTVGGVTLSSLSRLPSYLALLDLLTQLAGRDLTLVAAGSTAPTAGPSPQSLQRRRPLSSAASRGCDLVVPDDLPLPSTPAAPADHTACEERVRQLEAVKQELQAAAAQLRAQMATLERTNRTLAAKVSQLERRELQSANESRRNAEEAKGSTALVGTLQRESRELLTRAAEAEARLRELQEAAAARDAAAAARAADLEAQLAEALRGATTSGAADLAEAQAATAALRAQLETLSREAAAAAATAAAQGERGRQDREQLEAELKQLRGQLADCLRELQESAARGGAAALQLREEIDALQRTLHERDLQLKGLAQLRQQLEALQEQHRGCARRQAELQAQAQREREAATLTLAAAQRAQRPPAGAGISSASQTEALGHFLSNDDWDDYKMMRNVYYHSIMMHQSTINELKRLIA